VSDLPGTVDLIDKATSAEAATGAEASPYQGPGAAFIRPALGFRYFVILLDVSARTVQLAIVHPSQIPATIDALLPNLPGAVGAQTIDQLRGLRLPR
jgi:hypothetical protein